MNEEEITLIKQSWGQILSTQEEVGELFYQKLFELQPAFRSLFPADIIEQSRKFVYMITFIVYRLDSLDEVLTQSKELGMRHQAYKVSLNDFEAVQSTFFLTLEKLSKDYWNDDTKTVWLKAYKLVENAMKEGYKITS